MSTPFGRHAQQVEIPPDAVWVVEDQPPDWLRDLAQSEGWTIGEISNWRTRLQRVGVERVAINRFSDEHLSIDLGSTWELLNTTASKPLDHALGTAVARLEHHANRKR